MTGAVDMYKALPPSGCRLYHVVCGRGRGYVPGAAPVGVVSAASIRASMWCGSAGDAGWALATRDMSWNRRDSDRGYVPGAALISGGREHLPVAAGRVNRPYPSLTWVSLFGHPASGLGWSISALLLGYSVQVQLAFDLIGDVDFHRSDVYGPGNTVGKYQARSDPGNGHILPGLRVGTVAGGQSSLCQLQSEVSGVGRQASWHCGRWAKRPAPVPVTGQLKV